MSRRTSRWPPGTPCWVDVTASDVEAAQRSYSATLGWTYDPPAGPEFGGYTMARTDGAVASGLGPVMGGPPAWTVYLASDDADATAAAVTEHGGQVLMGPEDIGPFGRMVIAVDPQGAAFGVWQGREMPGAEIVNEPGALIWESLATPDTAAAQVFYGAVFGWTFSAIPDAPPGFATFDGPDGLPLGNIDNGDGKSPPQWRPFFGVTDADAAAAAMTGAGGTVVDEPTDTPWGRMAVLADPAGATFVVMTASDATPDRSG